MAKSSERPVEEVQDKQVPERPKKQSSGMSMPVIIAIIGGAIIAQVLMVVIILKFVITPQPAAQQVISGSNVQNTTENMNKQKSGDEDDEAGMSEEERASLIMHEIKNITASPKGSDRNVYVDVNFICLPKEKKLAEEMKKEFEKNLVGMTLIAETSYKINDIFSKYTKEQIDNLNRDSININIMNQLKPSFAKEGVKLRKVLVKWAFY